MSKFEDALRARRQSLPTVELEGIKFKAKPASQKTATEALFLAINHYSETLYPMPTDNQRHVAGSVEDEIAVNNVRKQGVIPADTVRDIRVWVQCAADLPKFRAFLSLLNEDGTGQDASDLGDFLEFAEAEDVEKINTAAKWPEYDEAEKAKQAAQTAPTEPTEGEESSPNE